MTLYEKIEEAFMEIATSATPGNNAVLGATNYVPQRLAKIATQIAYEHIDDEERKECKDVVTGA